MNSNIFNSILSAHHVPTFDKTNLRGEKTW